MPTKSNRESALKEQETLAAFIKKYQESRGVGSQNYAAYLKTYGTSADRAYGEALTAAHRTVERTAPRYGTGGESLAKAGSSSGYAAYLDTLSRRALDAKRKEALALYTEADAENQKGYAEYLSRLSSSLGTTINRMRSQSIREYNDAYAYTLAAGFDDETAHLAADLVTGMEDVPASLNEQKLRQNLLERMVYLGLPRDVAYDYALSCGVTSTVAAELAEACKKALEQETLIPY